MERIVLKGYYGFGNLGDDILMLTCANWMKEIYPDCKLYVATAAGNAAYIIPFTKGLVEGVLPVSPEPEANLIVHGGGGTFYDYDAGGFIYKLLNRLIGIVGVEAFNKVLIGYRKAKGWSYHPGTRRVALGIGVGTFTGDSKKYFQKITELSSLELILPRDPSSYQIIETMGFHGKLIQSSDLAFLDHYWIPSDLNQDLSNKNIGFVIKSWPRNNEYIEVLKTAASLLKDQGYSVTIFLFEKQYDSHLKTQFEGFVIEEWCPRSRSLTTYLRLLAKSALLVTSRAHGAIIGAALSIPALCIGIEPKLDQIVKMFPQSGQLLPVPFTLTNLYDAIISGLETPVDRVQQDFQNNKRLVLNSLKKLEKNLFNKNAG